MDAKPDTVLAKELISYHIPSVNLTELGDSALETMDDNKCSQLPIVEDGVYLGLISDEEILDCLDSSVSIQKIKSKFIAPAVRHDSHVYEALLILTQFKLSIVPVLGKNDEFLGAISIQDLAFKMADIANVKEPGGILILELNVRDYSLTKVAQIVESDDAKILSSYVASNADSLKMNLVLKINKIDLSAIISAFERYNYTIKASFHESKFDDDIASRYDQFLKYLSM